MASDLVPAFVELRRLHAEAVSNAGGDFEVDCDEAFRIFCMKNVPALLDAAERCAAAEAALKHKETGYEILTLDAPASSSQAAA